MSETENLFVLKWDYDNSVYYFFKGPPGTTQDDFSTLCNYLLESAITLALQHAAEDKDYVGWNTITHALAEKLEANGFTRFEPKTVSIEGPLALTAEDMADDTRIQRDDKRRITLHNDHIEATFDSDGRTFSNGDDDDRADESFEELIDISDDDIIHEEQLDDRAD